MTTFTSTVPGAVEALEQHFVNVSATNQSLNVGVYVGPPTGAALDNYLMIGDWQTGRMLTNYKQDWRGFPAAAARKSEKYTIPCNLRATAGDVAPVDRFNDAFTLMNGVLTELQNDVQGSGALSASGSWQVTGIDIPTTGILTGSGWGVLMTFNVDVINVQLPSS